MPHVPTPYSDINSIVYDFSERIQAILGAQFIGFYLYGSLALGDFDPGTSDIDFIVVTQTEISESLINLLRELHAGFNSSASIWANKVEAAYLPHEALNHPAPTTARYPQVEKGTDLFLAPLEIGWAFQHYILREHGIVIAGPAPRDLIDPVDPSDIYRAIKAIVEGWIGQSQGDPSWIAWARRRGAQAFIVLTLCRFLYFLETESLASKQAAAAWAQENIDGRWKAIIQRSLAGQHDPLETPQSDYDDMLALLHHVKDLVI